MSSPKKPLSPSRGAVAPSRGVALLEAVITDAGRYDARRVAEALDWSQDDIARYLGRDPSNVSRHPTAASNQEKLGALASLWREILTLMPERLGRAWLVTPIAALDRKSPKATILVGDLPRVAAVVAEIASGTLVS